VVEKTRVLRTKTGGVIIVINDLGRKKITSVLMLKKGLKEVEWHSFSQRRKAKYLFLVDAICAPR